MFFSNTAVAAAPLVPTAPAKTVKELVQEAFPDAPVMVAIAAAESQFNPIAKNPHSSATGVFQILTGTWTGYGCTGDRTNPQDNIRCARIIYEASGTSPWSASAAIWRS